MKQEVYINKRRRTPKPRTNNILDSGIRYSQDYSSGREAVTGDSSNFLKKNGSEDQYVNTFVNFQGVTKINNHEIWTQEQIQMLNKYLLFLGNKINAGHADNAKLWDNRLFEEFLNQPVRSDSSVVFDNITGGNIVASSYKTKDFTPGVFGTGVGTVGSDIHADSLYLRKMLVVTEMLLQKIRHQGGQIVLSSAGIKLTRIEEQEMFYRCYFDNCDNKINNPFVIDDQVRCQTFDGDIRYYWRLVTGTGIDYIDLSKTDVDGTSTPEIGDELVQLGNRTDVNRRGATIISSVGTEIGLFVYANIDSFSLESKLISWMGQLGDKMGGGFSGEINVNDTFLVNSEGRVTATEGRIGKFRIENGNLKIEEDVPESPNMIKRHSMSLNVGSVVINDHWSKVVVGTNNYTEDIAKYALGYFENFQTYSGEIKGSRNHGIYIDVRGARYNHAIDIRNGNIITRDAIYDLNHAALHDIDNSDTISFRRSRVAYVYNQRARDLYLPNRQVFEEELDINSDFYVTVEIVAGYGNGQPFNLRFKESQYDIIDQNANKVPYLRMTRGNAVRLQLTSVWGRYFAQILSKNF